MRDSFKFRKEYMDALAELLPEVRAKMMDAIVAYAFRGAEPSFGGLERTVFLLIKGMIDADEKNETNGKRGGRPKKETSKTPLSEIEKPQKPPFLNSETPFFENKNPLFEEKENPLDEKEGEKERSKEKSQERDYISQEKTPPPISPPSEGGLGEGEGCSMADFFKEFPSIQIDIRSPGETSGIDFALLAEKLRQSPYLRSRYSLRWLIRNYPDIQRDIWRDVPAPVPYSVPPGSEEAEREKRKRAIEERWKGVDLSADHGF